jgi:poly [ADP-ribose] polymerase
MSAQEEYLIFSDIGNNSYKYVKVMLDGNTLSSTWGRPDDVPQTKSWIFSDSYKAQKEFDKKIREKLKKGYEKVEVAGKSVTPGIVNKQSLADIAVKEIDTDSDTTKDLIKWLTQQNIHQITENTNITYNSSTGLFTTAIGVVVSQPTIDKARSVLASIASYVDRDDLDNTGLTPLINSYFKLIPQSIGRGRGVLDVRTLLKGHSDKLEKIKKQNDILDSLESSLTTMSLPADSSSSRQDKKVFNCKLHLSNDSSVFDEINKLFNQTKQSIHTSYAFKLDKVYTVDIQMMREAWKLDGAKLDNIMKLWHGSSNSNLLSILCKGMYIPPASASFCAGRNFGNGVYFSDQSTKSMNYSSGYWSGESTNRCFMFLADVALGKSFTPKSTYDSPFFRPGYDSVFAKGGQSGVLNNEFVIPRVSQCNLVYLCEFTK